MLKDFIVCRRGNRIIGVVGLEITKHGALLRSLAVADSDRNRGVGGGLVRSAERYASSRGARTLFLLTMTAEPFFARCHYRTFDRSAAPEGIQATNEFKTLCPDSAVCMRKDL
jgi:amino-acid N-acetyltransferase